MDWPNLFSILLIVVFVFLMMRCCGGMVGGGCGGRGEERTRKQPGRDSKPEETPGKTDDH